MHQEEVTTLTPYYVRQYHKLSLGSLYVASDIICDLYQSGGDLVYYHQPLIVFPTIWQHYSELIRLILAAAYYRRSKYSTCLSINLKYQ